MPPTPPPVDAATDLPPAPVEQLEDRPVYLSHTSITKCAHQGTLDARPPLDEKPAPMGPGAKHLSDLSDKNRSDTLNALVNVQADVQKRLPDDAAGMTVIPTKFDGDPAQATADAMARGDRVIIGGALPAGNARRGKHDLLVRVGDAPKADGNWEYAPVLVVNHRPLQGEAKAAPQQVSKLNDLANPTDTDLGDGRPRNDDNLRLAHLSRMLSDAGHGPDPDGPARAAVIDNAQRVVWRDLAEKSMFVTDPATGKRSKHSALDAYDIEFNRRVAALNGSGPPTEPELKEDCNSCRWRSNCGKKLAEADHVTLVRGMTPNRAQVHYREGIKTRAGLAALDHRTATLIDAKVQDLPGIVAAARKANPNTPAAKFAGNDEKTAAAFAAAGVSTARDLAALDDNTLRYSGKDAYQLANTIDIARVHVDGRPHVRRGMAHPVIPRADIEYDIDLENTNRVYLWGLRRTIRDNKKKPVVDQYQYEAWEDTDEAEASAFASMWSSIDRARKAATVGNRTFIAYHYGEHETRYMRDLAVRHAGRPGVPSSDEVESFVTSNQWVDMHKVASDNIIWPTPHNGLKDIGGHTGFKWSDPDAQGLASMAWHGDATNQNASDESRAAARKRLTQYNAEDCAAAASVRDWLTDVVPRMHNVARLDPANNKETSAA